MHILIIEDDTAVRTVTRLMLESAGYRVTATASGPEGIAAFRSTPPDLVLCDLRMPKMDGFSVIGTLRHECSAIKVIILTGNLWLEDASPAFASVVRDADEIVTKPFSRDALLAAVSRALLPATVG